LSARNFAEGRNWLSSVILRAVETEARLMQHDERRVEFARARAALLRCEAEPDNAPLLELGISFIVDWRVKATRAGRWN